MKGGKKRRACEVYFFFFFVFVVALILFRLIFLLTGWNKEKFLLTDHDDLSAIMSLNLFLGVDLQVLLSKCVNC